MKRILFYLGLLVLPLMGIGFDLLSATLREYSSQTFNLVPAVLFEVLANLLIIALIVWLSGQSKHTSIPTILAWVLLAVGLFLVSIPVLYFTGFSLVKPLQNTGLYGNYLGLAGAFLLVIGVIQLFSRKTKDR